MRVAQSSKKGTSTIKIERRSGRTEDLRRRAEEMARGKGARMPETPEALTPEETQRMLHELRVYKLELEMQNEELAASRARYLDLYDLAPAGYFTLSDKGLILEANLTAATLLNVPREALVKERLTSFILPEDQDIYYIHRKLLFETGEPQACELRMVPTSADPLWVNIREGLATEEETGKPVCLSVMSDISERKQVEKALRESEATFRNYIESAPDGVFVVDNTGRYLEANKSACLITGYSKEELIKISIRDLLAEESLEDGLAHFKKLLETGAAMSDLWHKHKDGSNRCLTVNAVKLSATQILGFCKDITQQKQSESQLNEQLTELQRWQEVTLGRESRIIDLKSEVNELLGKTGRPPRYPSSEPQDEKET